MGLIQSLSRGLIIIDLLSQADRSVSVTELAGELEIDKSSVTRLVHTLVEHGYAARDPHSRRYILGPKITEFALPRTSHTPLKESALPLLDELMTLTGENAHVGVYAEGGCLIVADIESTAQLRVVSGEGRLIPNHCTAVGKAILAFGDRALPKALTPHTPRTITSRSQMRLHLAQIRERGYAVDDEEHEIGVRCIAAPVYGRGEFAIASMGISGPTTRVTLAQVETLGHLVMEHAALLTDILRAA